MPPAETGNVAHTNVSDLDMTVFHLARAGYGSVDEIEQWDAPRFLDAVEYESILADLERYHLDRARRSD